MEVGGLPVTNSDTVVVTGNVVTIPSVQRRHSGNYSCNATNAVGSVVIYSNLLVVGQCCLYMSMHGYVYTASCHGKVET